MWLKPSRVFSPASLCLRVCFHVLETRYASCASTPARNGSGERFHQRFQGQENSHTNHQGEFIGKPSRGYCDVSETSSASCASLAPALAAPEPVAATSHEGWGIIRDLFPEINSSGLASVNHARGFSGSCTRFQCVTHEASVEHAPGFCGMGGGGRRLTFSENSGKFSSSPQNSGSHLPEILGNSGIVRGCTNHDLRRGGISVT